MEHKVEKKIRVLLVKPNFHETFVSFLPFLDPLSLLVLAACVRDRAKVEIFDRRFEKEKTLIKRLKQFKPDIVGVRTHTSAEINNAKRVLKLAKEINPSCTTIVGGQHATLMPDDMLEPYIDLTCIGPGEETLRKVVQAKKKGTPYTNIPGLAVRDGNRLIFTEEVRMRSGRLAWPKIDRSLTRKYRKHFFYEFAMSSTGCPYRCKFCSLWVTAQGTYRLRRPEEFVGDIESIKGKDVWIGDDNTFHDIPRARKIYELIKTRGIKKRYIAYARVDTIVANRDVFEKWKEIGLDTLVVGMEAFRQGNLTDINKSSTVEIAVKAHKILQEIGIYNWAHFIIFPDFTKKDFQELWKFVDDLNIVFPVFIPLSPLPGTELFIEARDKNELSIYDYSYFNLEYMVYRTRLPKMEFYVRYMRLWFKATSPITLLKRNRHVKVPFLRALVYTCRILKIFPRYLWIVKQQIEKEKIFDYKKAEPYLLPSLRKGYKFRWIDWKKDFESHNLKDGSL